MRSTVGDKVASAAAFSGVPLWVTACATTLHSVASAMATSSPGGRKPDALNPYVLATLPMMACPSVITAGEADGQRQNLRPLVTRRLSLAADRAWVITRLQRLLTMISPALTTVNNLELENGGVMWASCPVTDTNWICWVERTGSQGGIRPGGTGVDLTSSVGSSV
ncbi:hypothetical protein ACFP2T_35225 [Plantactinospora solaniradicis]|uniref:Uncharacterized protein n=1 Tax=Plantactinospora solaniradicis TaxID=1723736 RepID=A0ABW1KKQ7_9ACTN